MNRYRELNVEHIKTLSEEVREALDNLSECSKLPETDILFNKTILNAVKYNFIVAIQAIIDIYVIILSQELLVRFLTNMENAP